jgi:hypothetical protein
MEGLPEVFVLEAHEAGALQNMGQDSLERPQSAILESMCESIVRFRILLDCYHPISNTGKTWTSCLSISAGTRLHEIVYSAHPTRASTSVFAFESFLLRLETLRGRGLEAGPTGMCRL